MLVYSPLQRGSHVRWRSFQFTIPPLAMLLGVAVILLSINPIGYRGGGADDWHYLQAARCVVEAQGLCLPHTHWAARFPLVLPLAAALKLFGESRITLILVSQFFGLASLTLFWLVMKRQFGEKAATLAGFAMLATPAYALLMTSIGVDTVELCAMMGALLCIQSAVRNQSHVWAAAAGVLIGIAVLSRETSLILLPVVALAFLVFPAYRRHALPFVTGAACVLGGEAAAYAWVTGNPLYGWHLALAHAHLHSTEIATPLAIGESPLFNRHLIAGWKPSAGIHIHWTIDGLVNLLFDNTINITLLGALGLLAVERHRAGKAAWLLAIAAGFYFCVLTYALAIDPKPRMFMPIVAAASAIIGLQLCPLWQRHTRWLIIILFATMLTVSAAMVRDSYGLQPAEPVIAAWSAEAPGQTETDDPTHTTMTLVPSLRALPVYTPGSADGLARARFIIISSQSCSEKLAGWNLMRRQPVIPKDPAVIDALRRQHFLFQRHAQTAVCLFNNQRLVGSGIKPDVSHKPARL